MWGIRQKLMLGFGGLLAVNVVVGVMTMAQIDHLGKAIDLILRENYRSVVACQEMKESLERLDSGILFTLAGNAMEGRRLIQANTARFQAALEKEMGNITLPGEGARAQKVQQLFEQYLQALPLTTQAERPLEARQSEYFARLYPLFQQIKSESQQILEMNQANMQAADSAARGQARAAHSQMLAAIGVCALLALLFSYLAQRWILHPVRRLIESANEIRGGHLDLVVETRSRDEIGRLSEAFNEMAAALRQVRKEDRVNLMRTRRATEELFKELPAAIAVFDLEGRVEVATATANLFFGIKPGLKANDLGSEWLPAMIRKALDEGRAVEREPAEGYIQKFIDHHEYFFQPMVVPILLGPEHSEPTGTTLILKDVTQLQERQEMKRGVVSTVSHQLKTPLTSLRMSIHLLLEERIGPINEKQAELLVSAREDSERLVGILNDLLDIQRIVSGKARLAPKPVAPRDLAREALEAVVTDAKDKGVTVANEVSDELPEVMADPEKIRHVFANLLSNALRFTGPGGAVTLRAEQTQAHVAFFVEDTGQGVPERELVHLFEQFYRGSGQDDKSGVGLGLAIVKEIVRAHGGEVRAESVVGKGSRFCFTLPVRAAAAQGSPEKIL
ncbi:MAG: ATP-binding protein [Desulfobacteraceae bacterium]|nr:ATP-binding protein [Desulfobacteraceae bacterium]